MSLSHNYTVNIQWNEGRIGTMQSPELNNTIQVATPPQFPQGVEGIWSPEHLFTASVSSCFMTTFLAIAENSKLEFISLDVQSSGKLEQVEGKFMITEITLSPSLTITHAKDEERALRILQKSEAACLISNSIKSNIVLNPTILVQEAVAQ